MKKTYNRNIVIFLFLILILAGKVVRYTIMKSVLVDMGIGHGMITIINEGTASAGLTFSNTDAEDTVGASDNASYIFSLINFFDLETYEEFEVYISIIWNIILLALLLKVKDSLSLSQLIFLLASIAVLNIFDFCLAKEPVQMLYFVAMYIVLVSNIKSMKVKFGLCFLILILSGITYRVYYLIIAMFMVVVGLVFGEYIAKLDKVKKKNVFIILLGLGIFYFLFLNIVKRVMPTEYAELIRVRLRTSTATSDMSSIFHSSNLILFSIDYIIMIVRMLCPVELLRLGPKYFMYVAYQALITYMLIKSIIQYKNISPTRKVALYIVIAFVLGSAAFEPDFGSWVRHEAVIFPILLVLDGLVKSKNSEKQLKLYETNVEREKND